MPIYEYSCIEPSCQHVEEKFVRGIETDGEIECSVCGGVAMQVISLTGEFQWGGGFKERDARSEMYQDLAHSSESERTKFNAND